MERAKTSKVTLDRPLSVFVCTACGRGAQPGFPSLRSHTTRFPVEDRIPGGCSVVCRASATPCPLTPVEV